MGIAIPSFTPSTLEAEANRTQKQTLQDGNTPSTLHICMKMSCQTRTMYNEYKWCVFWEMIIKLVIRAQACNSSTQGAEQKDCQGFQIQPGYLENSCLKTKNITKYKL